MTRPLTAELRRGIPVEKMAADEIDRLREVLTRIAKQPKSDELESEGDGFQIGYDAIVEIARQAVNG